jgi:hypothetical protein
METHEIQWNTGVIRFMYLQDPGGVPSTAQYAVKAIGIAQPGHLYNDWCR